MTSMIDMAASKAEMKAESEKYKNSPIGTSPYRYGLTIRLDKLSLKKLGLKPGDVTVGEKLTVVCECEVSEVRQNNTKSHDESNIELQIEKMCIEDGSATDAVSRGIAKAGR